VEGLLTTLLVQSFPNPIGQIEHDGLQGQHNWDPLKEWKMYLFIVAFSSSSLPTW
jgi:hypothetical protein